LIINITRKKSTASLIICCTFKDSAKKKKKRKKRKTKKQQGNNQDTQTSENANGNINTTNIGEDESNEDDEKEDDEKEDDDGISKSLHIVHVKSATAFTQRELVARAFANDDVVKVSVAIRGTVIH